MSWSILLRLTAHRRSTLTRTPYKVNTDSSRPGSAAFLLVSSYRKQWKDWLWSFLLFGILIIPTVLLTFLSFQTSTTFEELWLLASRARFPMHLYPRSWVPLEIYIYV